MTAYGDTTESSPALARWGTDQQLLVAWTGGGGLGGGPPNWRLNVAAVPAGGPLTNRALVGEETSRGGLALCPFGQRLYLAWTGMDGGSSVNICPSDDGLNWRTDEKRWPLGQAIGGPTMTVYNQRLFLAFTGLDRHLYITSSADGQNFSAPQRLGGELSIPAPPSIATSVNPSTGATRFHLAWTQADTLKLRDAVCTFDPAGNLTGYQALDIGWTSSSGPSLCSGFGLLLVWIAQSGPQRMYFAARDAVTEEWDLKPTASSDTTPFPPGLASSGADSSIAWSGGGGLGEGAPNYRLNIAQTGVVFH
jgi:hypothetical protein